MGQSCRIQSKSETSVLHLNSMDTKIISSQPIPQKYKPSPNKPQLQSIYPQSRPITEDEDFDIENSQEDQSDYEYFGYKPIYFINGTSFDEIRSNSIKVKRNGQMDFHSAIKECKKCLVKQVMLSQKNIKSKNANSNQIEKKSKKKQNYIKAKSQFQNPKILVKRIESADEQQIQPKLIFSYNSLSPQKSFKGYSNLDSIKQQRSLSGDNVLDIQYNYKLTKLNRFVSSPQKSILRSKTPEQQSNNSSAKKKVKFALQK